MVHSLFSDQDEQFWRFYADSKLFSCAITAQVIQIIKSLLHYFSQDTKRLVFISDSHVQQTSFYQQLLSAVQPTLETCVGAECDYAPLQNALSACKQQNAQTPRYVGIRVDRR